MLKFIKKILTRKKSNHSKIDQLRYLSQSALIEESVTPHVVRTTLIMVSIIIIALIFWAGLTQVEEIAVTQGEVIPSQHLQSIQHLEGGIITEINVNDGELIEEGQILITLEGNNITQDLHAIKAKELALRYDAHRLRSFINQTTPNFVEISKEKPNKELEEEQLRAFNSMIESRESEKKIIQEQIDQKNDALLMLEKKKNTMQENLALITQEKELKQQLVEKGQLSKFKFLQMQKEFNDAEGELDETNSAIEQAKNSMEEFNERLGSLGKKHIDDAYRELDNVETDLAQIEETIKKMESQVDRLKIKSPVHGFIKGLKINTIGGVVEPGQVIMQIVPLEGPMVVETKINPRDIGHVKIGLEVNVKVSAYDFSRYGSVRGTLEYVSASTFINDKQETFYMGRVSLKQNHVGKEPRKNIIVPGMTVQAEIVTGSKSILAYLLKPIQTNLTTAFTER